MTSPVTLSQAISDVEQAQSTLTNAQGAQSTAADAVSAAQSKLDAANQQKSTADKTVGDAVSGFNAALDEVIASATAAKIPVAVAAAPQL